MFDFFMAYLLISFGCWVTGVYFYWVTRTDRPMPWAPLIVMAPVWPLWIFVLYYLAIKDLKKRMKK